MPRYLYPVDLETDETGRVVARVPDIAGCVTDGADRDEALHEAADALEESIAHAILNGEFLPAPSPVRGRPCVAPGAVIAAKAALSEAMRAAGANKSDMARKIGLAETEVRRMLDPRHATKMARLEMALAALGRRIVVTVEAA